MNLKKLIALSLVAMTTFSLVACGKKDTGNSSNAADKKIVKVGTSDPVIKEMLDAAKDEYKTAGYDMEITLFDGDIMSPNSGVAEGSLDINFYQHEAFLKKFNADKGTDLVSVGDPIYYSKMGMYSSKIKSLSEVKENMKVAIPSDATNKSRALVLLEDEGLIKLKDGLETYSKLDIEENKYNLEFVEMDTVKIPSALPDVDLAIVRAIEIMKSNMDPESALAFDKHGSKYGILLATKKENAEAKWATTLAETLKNSPNVKEVLESKYGTTSVIISE